MQDKAHGVTEEMSFSAWVEGKPPSVNHYLRSFRKPDKSVGVYKVSNARAWQENTAERLRSKWGGKPPYKDTVRLHIYVYAKNYKRIDVDNMLKPAQDCLQMAGILENDNQIEYVSIRKQPVDVHGVMSHTGEERTEFVVCSN
jgi:Holliday junction resolvase RusA-like endonuclease